MESICKSLGINTDVDLNNLLALLDKKNKAELAEMNQNQNNEDEGSMNNDNENENENENSERKNKKGNALELESEEILEYLRDFLQDKRKRKDLESIITYLFIYLLNFK